MNITHRSLSPAKPSLHALNAGPAIAASIPESARIVGVSRSLIYKMLNEGRLPSVKIGRRRVIPIEALRAFIEAQTQKAA